MDNPSNHKPMRIWSPDGEKNETRPLSDEVPVVLEYNCVTFAVMMASPTDLVDYSYGFSLTEGIIEKPSDVIYAQIKDAPKGKVAAIEINAHAFHRLETYNRTLSGRTGCGLCGVEKLDQAIKPLDKVVSDTKISPATIHEAMQKLKSEQHLNKETGALHAAAFTDKDGNIIATREDIGRHNALDKLIGHLIRENINPADGFAMITSRCSFEMVQKCAIAGIPVIAAVSATTELARNLAEEAGISLATFVRKDGLNIVTDSENRIS
ncbi:formate dehydrogenase accessory sulfurtransferase FdhD [Pseudemcibacter aquimaris]|uniref:formate dehydrogenase accessory sulfurtransferase FdhD n=1 Tax=Pseudemcibacter aquimaris TaxID=2857064 RepID=UPI002011F09E|nr:formate dehydrogenase accessory sulfurtransferase FdhD [Pseudemcibacter aquimaris]MCC3861800.1 formate dehydrogenase accessory sulfurtransferase FdhD [Pseudemcibacter aquimaris]WDU58555.1 formate dehydrogenase accessory sulfurtransferase FdhD [Pseudemcibacter aquimaris]